jgi:lipopolysaccharide/colanic/teichoic acid biosynthesis glycosyltransferase
MNAHAAIEDAQATSPVSHSLLLAPSLERRRLQCYLAQICVDVAMLLGGFAMASFLYTGSEGVAQDLVTGQLVLPIFLTIALYNSTYSIDSLSAALIGISRALVALVLSAMFVALIAFVTKSGSQFSRVGFFSGTAFAGALLFWSRLTMRSFVRWRCGAHVRNDLIINDGGPEVSLPGAIEVSAARLGLRADLDDPDVLDRVGSVLRNIDRVLVSCPVERRAAWAMILKGANVEGEVLDEQVVALGAQGARVIGGHGVLLVSAGPLGLRARVLKRLFDVVCAGSALVALAPLLLVVALAIKLEDGGRVLFVQKRVGRGNRFFEMYKFRSMSEQLSDRDGSVSASRNDQRVTRVGAFMRRTSIDELPQLFNVVLGNMSIVGPRPHALGSHAGEKLFWEVDRRYWHRHSLKPGLSGLAQVRGFRGATDCESDLVDRLQSDLEYLEGWTIVRDITIILLTMRVLVHDRAY